MSGGWGQPCFTWNWRDCGLEGSQKNIMYLKIPTKKLNRYGLWCFSVHLQVSVLMGVVSALLGCQRCRRTETNGRRLWSDDTWSLSSRVKFMGGMGVVQDPGALGVLGTVVKLQEITASVPRGPTRLTFLKHVYTNLNQVWWLKTPTSF